MIINPLAATMAEAVLASVVESVTGHLLSLVSQEIGLARGVSAELVKLQTTVSIIGGVLREADRRPVEAEDTKEWLKNLKELFYDADDLLDDFSTEVLRRRRVTGGVERIFNEENVSVLPIVGVGGLGKTTLARLVFNDDKVTEYFEMKLLWVCVSINFNVEDILRKIVRECTPSNNEGIANLRMSELLEKLKIWIDGKKFLLVLDDVWKDNRTKWLELREFLMSGAKGSKILVTARYPRVAETMTREFHELSGLPDDDSLSLLMQMAMKEEREWKNQNLEKIAREIVKKCAGVPLAIKTIGRLLVYSGCTEGHWLYFKDNDLSSINQEECDIMPTLKLSYDFLPSHLKPCFAYCSLFPQDYVLEPRELVYLWMAQGFINKPRGSGKTLEEVGYDYFKELLSRSFFQDIKEDLYGDIMSCRMHDLMHDLARLVAGDNCITIDSSREGKFQGGARHVTTDDLNVFNGFEGERRIRSLFLIFKKWIDTAVLDVSCFRSLRALRIRWAKITEISRSIGKLKHLRSLDLSGNDGLRCLPDSISMLCNLENLNLTECWDLEGLPSGITKLVNLRQLSVSGCENLTHMPRGMGTLTNLQKLDVFVVGEESNQNAAGLNELSRLIGLKKELTIRRLERVGSSSISSEVDASFSMEKLADLQCLVLSCSVHHRDTSNDEEVLERLRPHPYLKGLRIKAYWGARLPSWISQLHRLVQIEIAGCHRCRQLSPVDHLPFLKRISLRGLSNLEHIELSEGGRMPQSNFFPSLEEIELEYLPEFKGWEWERRGNRIEEEDGDSSSSSLLMLHSFSDKVKVKIDCCSRFSYMHGQQLLQLTRWRMKDVTALLLHQNDPLLLPLGPQRPMAVLVPTDPSPSTDSLSLTALTSLSISYIEDAEHLPVELFQSLPSLHVLYIRNCPRLKALPLRAILRHLPTLETLAIANCTKLDLSTENGDDDDGGGNAEGMTDLLQLQGHHKLRHLSILGVHKTECLPGWFQYFSNLQILTITDCKGLKSLLPGRLILPLLTSLDSLVLSYCPELDLSIGESEDMPMAAYSQFTKLRELEFYEIEKMETLPWWIQHLTNLESLVIISCENLKALPEWFPNLTSLEHLAICSCGEELTRRCQGKNGGGEDWPKISHIPHVEVER
ncbi:putative disease resistance protein RGA4 isoform X1 [Punica granatum]|uniref:Disease resistance protein RGA4 isoform X1 n=1 Tax=Punica granatum TaxID=22663 RepID=A0A6P8EM67_PUNGR|nr:putative disease resistance protein RGA4 isoform X1 [Punica granatum]XP_031407691.1 putative disease resistance protein RGA4 isoform X1 [Punica granatum]XP_031407693.1 putative disease resistance protein RGA4 isoform X1 [Punica granatum]XP_031407694.1 putative disease resistance protein RGA4 isoform X1 [Punica granatum]XP_031407695.1 putative disease resistance protein RGA4 isoform X1 [Punica granatum]XP_031407696.1 putative disease resistance protein RGA4 isoform X1 [Punica granatum]XP_03